MLSDFFGVRCQTCDLWSDLTLAAVGIDEVLSASFKKADQLSNEKRAPGCSGYIEDYTTQLYNGCKNHETDPY